MMRARWISLGALVAACVTARSAFAEEPRPLELGASLSGALPAGAIERGSRTSDVAFGAALGSLDVALRVHPAVDVGFAFAYGAVVPTLCASAAECVASTGHDASFALLGRWRFATWHALRPALEASLGYEWLETHLVDGDVSASRRYRGLAGGVAVLGGFALSERWTLGPTLGMRGGVFARARIDAPGIGQSRATDGARLHAWPFLGVRLAAHF